MTFYFFTADRFTKHRLRLSPKLAVVDKHQTELIKLLESRGIDVRPILLRHGRTLGGGFHCITLDVRRKGNSENLVLKFPCF